MAPLAWAVDGSLVGFNLLLALQQDVSLHCLRSEGDLQKFVRSKRGVVLLPTRRQSSTTGSWLWVVVPVTVRCHALDIIDVTLGDARIVKVLKARDAKDVRAAQEPATINSFLWFQANSAFEGLVFKFLPLSLVVEVQQSYLQVSRQTQFPVRSIFNPEGGIG